MMRMKIVSCILFIGFSYNGVGAAQNNNSAPAEDASNRVEQSVRSEFTFSQKPNKIGAGAIGKIRLSDAAQPQQAIAEYLVRTDRDVRISNTLRVKRSFTSKFGRRHVEMEEVIGGVRVYGSKVKLAADQDGNIVYLSENLPDTYVDNATGNPIDQSAALRAAAAWNFNDVATPPRSKSTEAQKDTFDKGDFFYEDPTVERVLLRTTNGQLEHGAVVFTWSKDTNLLYETIVDARGRIVENRLRTAFDSYRIFPDHPGNSSQTIRNGPGSGNTQSPNGWLSGSQTTINISGNNVHAYLDVNFDNAPDAGGTSVTTGNFLATANLSQAPTTTSNQAVAVQNLFYWNNVIHDELYDHGFTEAVGNFQEDNFGKGGSGSDSVNAEAQDGCVRLDQFGQCTQFDNASFAPTTDGTSPRMQMGLFSPANPDRDSDVDSDIIWHEYGHGLTWRMVGNMGGAVSAGIGEGMSDVLAIIKNNNDVVGEYATNDAGGIRRDPYTNYPRTLIDYDSSPPSPHPNGEIYAAAIWRLWEIFQDKGLSADLLMDHLVDGLNFTPGDPDYLDMRDGLLASTPNNIDRHVWQAFADFGMGVDAVFNPPTIVESFNTPGAFAVVPLNGFSLIPTSAQ